MAQQTMPQCDKGILINDGELFILNFLNAAIKLGVVKQVTQDNPVTIRIDTSPLRKKP